MNPDTKAQIKSVAVTTGVIGGALFLGWLAIPQPPKRLYLKWDNAPGATVTDVWVTTNMTAWSMIGSVTNTNIFRMPNIGPQGFFRVSHRVKPDGTME